jgi:hypothetical protein
VTPSVRFADSSPDGEHHDGVAELWWDSFEDLAANAADPAAREAGRMLLEDEKRFIDLTRSPLWWGEEREIIATR